MTTSTHSTQRHIDPKSLVKKMLLGAAIGLAVISFFLLQVNHTHAEWGKFWMARPLVVLPLAGATGGAFFYFMENLRYQGWKKIAIRIVSLLVFVIGIWMGIVIGLHGTLWN